MIVYPAGLALSATTPLNNARIGYKTYTKDKTSTSVIVSSESAIGARDNPLRPDTFEYWEPTSLPATWQLDFGALSPIDYVGIAGHNIGSVLDTVGVFIGEDTNFDARIEFPGITGNYMTTPDSAANSILGDIDIRVQMSLTDWTPTTGPFIVNKMQNTNDRAYRLTIQTTGNILFEWSTDGTLAGLLSAASSVAVPFADGATGWIRVTLDVDNGAAGRTTTFYTSTDGIIWTQLGTVVTVGVITSIFNATGALDVFNNAAVVSCKIYKVEIYNVINGTIPVVRINPSEALTDANSIVSSTGETWTIFKSGLTQTRLVNPRFSTGDISPVDNAPIMFLDIPRTARYMQIKLTGTGTTMPRFSVVYAGVALAMQRAIYGGHAPISLSRQTQMKQPVSRGGQFLGQSFRRLGVATSVAWKNLGAAWYRQNFDPFVKEARKNPYFFAWRPQSYPLELGYVWTGDDIAPSNMGIRDLMEVSMKVSGIGYE